MKPLLACSLLKTSNIKQLPQAAKLKRLSDHTMHSRMSKPTKRKAEERSRFISHSWIPKRQQPELLDHMLARRQQPELLDYMLAKRQQPELLDHMLARRQKPELLDHMLATRQKPELIDHMLELIQTLAAVPC